MKILLFIILHIFRVSCNLWTNAEDYLNCQFCKTALILPQFTLKNEFLRPGIEFGISAIIDMVDEILITFKNTGIIPKNTNDGNDLFKGIGLNTKVLDGIIHETFRTLLPALADGTFSDERVCYELLQVCKDEKTFVEDSLEDYIDQRMKQKPHYLKNDSFVDDLYKRISEDPNPREIVRQIQFSDAHVDFLYEEGQPAECDSIVCCRKSEFTSGVSFDNPRLAGKWGDYNCDLPMRTVQSMFDFIAANQETFKTDFITWTGDNSVHNIWSNTKEEITEYTVKLSNALRNTLGHNSKIDVFPIEGNHDLWPSNTQDFSEANSNWAINHFKKSWNAKNWLNDAQTREFGKYGYYSKPLSFDPKGLVIGLNMQACYAANWWILKNREDPGHQLRWLEQQLRHQEKIGGYALIIGHIPSVDCDHQFGARLNALMDRYQHVVRLSIYAHKHIEQFYLTQAIESTKSIGLNLMTGSLTSIWNTNPSFQLIEYDKEFMVPIDVHTFYMNLTEANLNGHPNWKYMHSFKKEYALKDLSPKEMHKLTQRLAEDPDLASQFEWNQRGRARDRPVKSSREIDPTYLCLQFSESQQRDNCLNNPFDGFSVIDKVSDFLIGKWIKNK